MNRKVPQARCDTAAGGARLRTHESVGHDYVRLVGARDDRVSAAAPVGLFLRSSLFLRKYPSCRRKEEFRDRI